MNGHLVLIFCCAVTIFAAPLTEENGNDAKLKRKVRIEVKPIDLQVKFAPLKIQPKTSEKRLIVTTSTTTEPATTEPFDADTTDSTTKSVDESVHIANNEKPSASLKKVI